MRLIDADNLIEKLKSYAECDWNKSLCTMLQSVVDDCIEFVYEQPTAYSVGKAVEELENLKDKGSVTKTGMLITKACVDRAIEIVKQFCVTDDVCEWKLDGVYLNSPHKPLVSCVTDENYQYNYCPVCGKKIKVVE